MGNLHKRKKQRFFKMVKTMKIFQSGKKSEWFFKVVLL
jgi:hypothetical protein